MRVKFKLTTAFIIKFKNNIIIIKITQKKKNNFIMFKTLTNIILLKLSFGFFLFKKNYLKNWKFKIQKKWKFSKIINKYLFVYFLLLIKKINFSQISIFFSNITQQTHTYTQLSNLFAYNSIQTQITNNNNTIISFYFIFKIRWFNVRLKKTKIKKKLQQQIKILVNTKYDFNLFF